MSTELTALRERLRALLSGDFPDPYAAAREVRASLSGEEREALIDWALPDLAREEIRHGRLDAPALGSTPVTGSGNRSRRWERARTWADSLYSVNGSWMRLGDCSADEVELIATDYEDRAARNAELAQRFRDLATEMRAAGAVRADDVLSVESEAA